jgi:hypothetical protein
MPDRPPNLMPLEEVATLVYQEATGRTPTEPVLLDSIAASIAKHVPIFACEGWGQNRQLVPADMLEAAKFQNGGTLMRSRNVSYSNLCIRRGDLAAVLEKVAGLYKPNG